MTRSYVDCRELPGRMECSISIAADSEQELIEATVHHLVSAHGERDSIALREELRRHVRIEQAGIGVSGG